VFPKHILSDYSYDVVLIRQTEDGVVIHSTLVVLLDYYTGIPRYDTLHNQGLIRIPGANIKTEFLDKFNVISRWRYILNS
jgi:hypothetical protein